MEVSHDLWCRGKINHGPGLNAQTAFPVCSHTGCHAASEEANAVSCSMK